jgi:hypothetical protein
MRFSTCSLELLLLLSALVPVGAALPPPAQAGEPSPAYKAALRRTAELRKQRRRSPLPAPIGVIVPYPMPPSLIIRQTPEVHDEIEGLLRLLRSSSR